MFEKFKKKQVRAEVPDTDKTTMDNLLDNLELARKSKGFLICITRLENEARGDNVEEKLRHYVCKRNFKDGDINSTIEEYKKLATPKSIEMPNIAPGEEKSS